MADVLQLCFRRMMMTQPKGSLRLHRVKFCSLRQIEGQQWWIWRYADDAVLIAETREDLPTLINKIVTVSEEY